MRTEKLFLAACFFVGVILIGFMYHCVEPTPEPASQLIADSFCNIMEYIADPAVVVACEFFVFFFSVSNTNTIIVVVSWFLVWFLSMQLVNGIILDPRPGIPIANVPMISCTNFVNHLLGFTQLCS